MVRKGRTFVCPNCEREISKDAIRIDRVFCPLCSWQLKPSPSSNRTRMEETVDSAAGQRMCPCCSRTLGEQDIVRLWDGNDYCVRCVEESAPGLVEYARQHAVLKEVLPFSFRRVLLSSLYLTTLFALLLTTFFVVLIVIAALCGKGPAGQVPVGQWVLRTVWGIGGFFASAWCFAAVISFPLVFLLLRRSLPRTIELEGGRLRVRPPGDRVLSLDQLSWGVTKSKYDGIAGLAWPRRKGMVLFGTGLRFLSNDKQKPEKRGCLVAFDAQSVARWRSFLTLAGVPEQQVRPWRTIEREIS
jgi:hypothetical protein